VTVPVWLLIVCMILANYRVTRLAVKDTFPPVLWLRDRLAGGWRPLTDKELETVARQPGGNHPYPMQKIGGVQHRWVTRRSWSPYWLADLVSCPWCVSGWLAAALTAAVALTVGVPAPFLVWGAVWAGSALIASREWA
jgi:hypothetical protein